MAAGSVTRAALTRVAALTLAVSAGVSAVAAAGACAAGTRGGPPRARRGTGDLTRAQMMEAGYHNLYAAVEGLRARWLVPRGVDSFQSPGQIVVYIDNTRAGGVEALRSLAPSAVAYVRHYDATQAQARWGVGHTQGVIYVALLESQ